jgi:hypothetical protein
MSSCVAAVTYPTANVTVMAGSALPVPVTWVESPQQPCNVAPTVMLQLDLSRGKLRAVQQWGNDVQAASLASATQTSTKQHSFTLPLSLQTSSYYFIAVGDGAQSPFFTITGPKPAFDQAFADTCSSDCCIDVAPPTEDAFTPQQSVPVAWSVVGKGCGSQYALDLMLDASAGAATKSDQRIVSPEPVLAYTAARSDADASTVYTMPASTLLASDYYYIRVTNRDVKGRGSGPGVSTSSIRYFNLGGPPSTAGQSERTNAGSSSYSSSNRFQLLLQAAVACLAVVATLQLT